VLGIVKPDTFRNRTVGGISADIAPSGRHYDAHSGGRPCPLDRRRPYEGRGDGDLRQDSEDRLESLDFLDGGGFNGPRGKRVRGQRCGIYPAALQPGRQRLGLGKRFGSQPGANNRIALGSPEQNLGVEVLHCVQLKAEHAFLSARRHRGADRLQRRIRKRDALITQATCLRNAFSVGAAEDDAQRHHRRLPGMVAMPREQFCHLLQELGLLERPITPVVAFHYEHGR
jgi:hypothetical protein